MAFIVRDRQNWCRPKRPNRKRSCCVSVDTPIEHPDPATYSQQEQISLGQIPNWNSPDITTNHWSPFRLYKEPEVTVRNLSPDASAMGVLVHFSTSAFGIGMQRSPAGTQVVNLAPNQEVLLKFPLSQAVLNGEQRIGTYVQLEHPHDENLANNNGDQIHDGAFTSESGRDLEFEFPVLNNSGNARAITLTVLANDLNGTVTPAVHNFSAFEQIQAKVKLQVPNSLHGAPGNYHTREVTVVGHGPGGEVIDGVTFVIRVDN